MSAAPVAAAATCILRHSIVHAWLGGVMVRALDVRLERSRVRMPAVPLSGNNLGQVVHTSCASLTKQSNLVPVKGR